MHHPFYEWFVIEAPYKWRPCLSYNIPYEEMMETIDHALQQGYTVAWGGDVSGNGFDRKGLAIAGTPEQVPSQGLRQVTFDNWQSTYDHVMLIFGIAKDQNGREYYMVKNSWGDAGNYHGIWYMTKTYIAIYTTYIFLNKEALPKSISDKIIRG
jgi:aminopeptidase C